MDAVAAEAGAQWCMYITYALRVLREELPGGGRRRATSLRGIALFEVSADLRGTAFWLTGLRRTRRRAARGGRYPRY
ncbi:MAG: hypothetical protein N3D83_05645 [Pyrobaculum aerophilum]|nr:hypothetical protein [Pyrobaculum aerophilum]HII46459.1 hypothetical protein [Pyrobaculum aerophilum]